MSTETAPRSIAEAELRQATILKCDIVDSTRIWGRLDPSDRLDLTRAVKKTVEELIRARGGYVSSWEGDGVSVLFGYPDAREDMPETAVRAGLELVEAVRSVKVPDERLEFRIGIASGAVAIDLATKTLDGVPFSIAERLKTIAEPGWVVISESTRHLVKSFFDYEDLGLRAAKGFDEGLHAWRAVRESRVVSRFDAQRLEETRTEIIGRDAELATLAEAWNRARAGDGQVVRIVADAGMGKSKLGKAVLEWAARDGAAGLTIDCTPSTVNSPMYPIGVLLRRTAHIASTMSDAEKSTRARALLERLVEPGHIDEALGYLSPFLGLHASAIPTDATPERVHEETIAHVVGLLNSLAAQGPLVVLCEDMHWADATTVQVLQRVAGVIAGSLPVLLILTSREVARPVVAGAGDPAPATETTLRLESLGAAHAAAMVRAISQVDVADDVVAEIVARSEGVPLIVSELTRSTAELAARNERRRLPRTQPGADVPASLKLIVESRLDHWQQQRPIVQAASVLGREFSLGLLQQMVPQGNGDSETRADAAAAIDLLDNREFFEPRGEGDRVRFTHAMIRDAVYQTLLRDDRRRLHARAADLMLARDPQRTDTAPDAVAWHLCEARRFEEAVRLRLDASTGTAARGAYVETEGHCEAALRIIDEIEDPVERRMLSFRLLVQLGVALTGRYGYAAPQVENAYRRARTVCGETTEAAMLYPIMRGLTALNLVRGNLATGYELSIQSMDVAERAARPEFRIDAISIHCYASLYYRKLDECKTWIDRCLALYREEKGESFTYPVPNDPRTAALAILPTVEWLLGDSEACEAAIAEGLAHVERTSRDFDKAYMHSWIAGVRYTQRRYPDSIQHAQIAIGISQKNGFREWYVTSLLIDLLSQASMAPAPAALQAAFDTCMAMAREGVGLNASWYLWAMARGHVQAGNPAVAGAVIEQAFERARASGESRMDSELLMFKAELEPDATVAGTLLEKALAVAEEQGSIANALRAAALLVLRRAEGSGNRGTLDGTAAGACGAAGAASAGPRASAAEASAVGTLAADTSIAKVTLGRETLDILDGRSPCPSGRWMRERLEALRERTVEERQTPPRRSDPVATP